MVHGVAWSLASGLADDLGWNTRNRLVGWYVLQDDRSGRDPRAFADADIAKHLGAGADPHAIADFRVTVAAFLARAAKRHRMQHRDIIADHGRLADDKPMRMVDHDAAPNPCGGVDVDREKLG